MAGRCAVLGAILWPKVEKIEHLVQPATESENLKLRAELSITSAARFGENLITEVEAVRTQRDFGCVFHWQPGDPVLL
jgi:hypothetical protein